MKQETKGKIFVGMIISVLAFGFATGTGIFIGANPLNSIGVLNLTNQGEFPTITSMYPTQAPQTAITTTHKTSKHSEPKTTQTTTDNSSSTPTKTNTSTTNSSG